MQYTVSMSTRMLAIAGLCVFLLCVLLFLLGIELGKRFAEPGPAPETATMNAPPAAMQYPPGTMPKMPATPAVPGLTAPGVTAPAVTAPAVTAPGITAPAVTPPAVQRH